MANPVGYYSKGYNCAESILKAVGEDKNLDLPVNIATPFGGGMAVGTTCGAVTGAVMAIGALKGRKYFEETNETRAVSRAILGKIKEKYGTLECKQLKKQGVTCEEIIGFSYKVLNEYI